MAQKQTDYASAIARKFPEQVVIALAKDAKGIPNPITLGWTMIVSGTPPMMAIAVAKGHYSVGAIRHSKEFVIAFPAEDMGEEVLFYGTHSGRDTEKLKAHPCALQQASGVDGVLLADAVANFECRLASELETGDHIVFVGEVVAAHVNPEPKQRLYTVGPGYKMSGVRPTGGPRRSREQHK